MHSCTVNSGTAFCGLLFAEAALPLLGAPALLFFAPFRLNILSSANDELALKVHHCLDLVLTHR